jgi:hypothetical protein
VDGRKAKACFADLPRSEKTADDYNVGLISDGDIPVFD